MTTATAPKFRYIGVTDDCVTCQNCGKDELKSTVVLAILDADGNQDGDVTYYGSSCAARALGVRGGGRAVLTAAQAAHRQTIEAARNARDQLAYYGLPETGQPTSAVLALATARYATVHEHAMWAADKTWNDWEAMVQEMITRRQATIAEAALIGA
jgi:hypothetical protein